MRSLLAFSVLLFLAAVVCAIFNLAEELRSPGGPSEPNRHRYVIVDGRGYHALGDVHWRTDDINRHTLEFTTVNGMHVKVIEPRNVILENEP